MQNVAGKVSQDGARATLRALSRAADPSAVSKLSMGEMADWWPGCGKQLWNYAHIMGGAQRMSEQHLRRAARSTKTAAPAGAARSGSTSGTSSSGGQ